MNDDVKSASAENPKKERETTEPNLGQLVSDNVPAASQKNSVPAFVAKAAAEKIKESPKPVVATKTTGVKGVYGSSDVGRKANQDPIFRVSCYNQVPSPEDIRRFRREGVQKALEKVLRFARAKVAEAWSPANPFRSTSATPASLVPGRSEETQSFARREASERIDKATFTDGMSM